MKTTLVFLLLIFFGNISVEAVLCFSCTSSNNNNQCNQGTIECNSPQDNCMTSVEFILGQQSITKGCSTSSTCSAASYTNINLGGVVGNQVSCCRTFLCNISGSTACGHNLLLLALSAILSGLCFGL
ncbi:hypothetical protein UPYG_G00333590 [Umbra pygmaea]|uniref:UPAR/Ly6 domain-containing protein n=1 Tax=Umbra pygmaea TaxID=75934 RepID=A0ABD0VWG2_UMBPY